MDHHASDLPFPPPPSQNGSDDRPYSQISPNTGHPLNRPLYDGSHVAYNPAAYKNHPPSSAQSLPPPTPTQSYPINDGYSTFRSAQSQSTNNTLERFSRNILSQQENHQNEQLEFQREEVGYMAQQQKFAFADDGSVVEEVVKRSMVVRRDGPRVDHPITRPLEIPPAAPIHAGANIHLNIGADESRASYSASGQQSGSPPPMYASRDSTLNKPQQHAQQSHAAHLVPDSRCSQLSSTQTVVTGSRPAPTSPGHLSTDRLPFQNYAQTFTTTAVSKPDFDYSKNVRETSNRNFMDYCLCCPEKMKSAFEKIGMAISHPLVSAFLSLIMEAFILSTFILALGFSPYGILWPVIFASVAFVCLLMGYWIKTSILFIPYVVFHVVLSCATLALGILYGLANNSTMFKTPDDRHDAYIVNLYVDHAPSRLVFGQPTFPSILVGTLCLACFILDAFTIPRAVWNAWYIARGRTLTKELRDKTMTGMELQQYATSIYDQSNTSATLNSVHKNYDTGV